MSFDAAIFRTIFGLAAAALLATSFVAAATGPAYAAASHSARPA